MFEDTKGNLFIYCSGTFIDFTHTQRLNADSVYGLKCKGGIL